MTQASTEREVSHDSTDTRHQAGQTHKDRRLHSGTRGQGRGDRELVCNGDRDSLWEDGKVLKMDGGEGCKIM